MSKIIFEDFFEIGQLVDDNDPALADLRIDLRPVVRRLVETEALSFAPGNKISPSAVVFHLSDTPGMNAFVYLGNDRGKNKLHIAFTRDLLTTITVEDMLAGAIGHEIAHRILRKQTGHTGALTKAEEGWAHLKSADGLVEAGYNWKSLIEFIMLMAKKRERSKSYRKPIDFLDELMDEHPLDGHLVNLIELKFAKKTITEEGKIVEPAFTPLPEDIVNHARRAAPHRNYFLHRLPNYDRLTDLEKFKALASLIEEPVFSEAGEQLRSVRMGALDSLLSELRLDAKKPEAQEAIGNFLAWWDQSDFSRGIYDYHAGWDGRGAYRFDQRWLYGKLTRTTHGDIPPLGPCRKIAAGIRAFIRANDDESITAAANDVAACLHKARNLPWNSIVWPRFKNDARTRKYHRLALLPEHRNIRFVLGRTGGLTRKLLEEMPDDMLNDMDSFWPFTRNRSFIHNLGGTIKEIQKARAAERIRNAPPVLLGDLPENYAIYFDQNKDVLFPSSWSVPENHRAVATALMERFKELAATHSKPAKEMIDNFYTEYQKQSSGIKKAALEGHPYAQYAASLIDPELIEKVFFKDVKTDELKYINLARAIYHYRIPRSLKDVSSLFNTLCEQGLTVKGTRKRKNRDWGTSKIYSADEKHSFRSVAKAELAVYLGSHAPIDVLSNRFRKILKVWRSISGYYGSYPAILRDKITAFNGQYDENSFGRYTTKGLITLYKTLEYNNLFPDAAFEKLLSGAVLARIETTSDATKAKRHCERLILRGQYGSPLPSIEFRDAVLEQWIPLVKKEYDLLSPVSKGKHVLNLASRVAENTSWRDRTIFLARIADALEIQPRHISHFESLTKPSDDTLIKTHFPLVGAEAFITLLGQNDAIRLAGIDFISREFDLHRADNFINVVFRKQGKKNFEQVYPPYKRRVEIEEAAIKEQGDQAAHDRYYKNSMTAEHAFTRAERTFFQHWLHDFHHHYWSLDHQQRTVVMHYMLMPGEHRISHRYEDTWKTSHDLVIDRLFPLSLEHTKEARGFVESFIRECAEHERIPVLSAMMTASLQSDTQGITRVGRRLALLLKMMGPAYIKLGQAIHSHPATPAAIREDLKDLKGQADPMYRWDLLALALKCLPKSLADRIVHFGEALGDASMNIALAAHVRDGEHVYKDVLLLERPNAAKRAETGFDHLFRTIKGWASEFAGRWRPILLEMVDQARALARVETDRSLGNQQYETMKTLYGGKFATAEIEGRSITIEFVPVDHMENGAGYRHITFAEGLHFNELPETTSEEINIKKAIAHAYLALEAGNLLSEGYFDCDRHSRQMRCVKTSDNHYYVGIFDPGGIAIVPPTGQEKATFGRILFKTYEALMDGKNFAAAFEQYITYAHNRLPSDYLLRVRKGWLALQDFAQYVTNQDEAISILRAAVMQKRPDADILKGMGVSAMRSKKSFIAPLVQATSVDQLPDIIMQNLQTSDSRLTLSRNPAGFQPRRVLSEHQADTMLPPEQILTALAKQNPCSRPSRNIRKKLVALAA